MRQDEFVEIHGMTAWNKLVKPRNRPGSYWPFHVQCNANVLVSVEIYEFLESLGLPSVGLLEAQPLWEAEHPNEGWEEMLERTIFSKDYYRTRFNESWKLARQHET